MANWPTVSSRLPCGSVPSARPFAWSAVSLAVAGLLLPLGAQGSDPFLVLADTEALRTAPSYRYANVPHDDALAQLRARAILFQQASPARGVDAPIRLTSRLHGVHFHSMLPESARPASPFEICDARLALALDDFASILARHDITEVVHFSMYRPAVPAAPARRVPALLPLDDDAPSRAPRVLPTLPDPSAPAATLGSRAVATSSTAGTIASVSAQPAATPVSALAEADPAYVSTPSRHPAGLAIDAAIFRKKDGTQLSVASDFAGHIGSRTCGAGLPAGLGDRARELHELVCEAADARVFTYILTPNYNYAHRDHFHMEIKSGVRWFLVH